MGLVRWIADELDFWLPRDNVWSRGIILWALVVIPLFIISFLIATFYEPDATGFAAVFAIIGAIFVGWMLTIVFWAWWVPRIAIRRKKWHRPKRVGVSATVNAVGGLFLATVYAVFAVRAGDEFLDVFLGLAIGLAVLLGTVGAVSGLFTSDKLLVEVPPPLPEYATGTKST